MNVSIRAADILRRIEQLIVEHSTPSGLNEQALRELNGAGWDTLVSKALDLIEDRLNGRADFESRMQ